MRHPGPGDGRWLCIADGCDQVGTHGWTRATDTGTAAVIGCDDHKISDDLAGHVHLPACQAPPECTCGGRCAPGCPCKESLPAGFLSSP